MGLDKGCDRDRFLDEHRGTLRTDRMNGEEGGHERKGECVSRIDSRKTVRVEVRTAQRRSAGSTMHVRENEP